MRFEILLVFILFKFKKTSQHFQNSSLKVFMRVWVLFLCCTLTGLPQCVSYCSGIDLLLMSSADTHSSWIRVDSLVYTTSVPPILTFTVIWVITNLLLMFLSHKTPHSTADFSAWLHDLTHWHAFISFSLSLSHTRTHTHIHAQIEPLGRLVLEKALHVPRL